MSEPHDEEEDESVESLITPESVREVLGECEYSPDADRFYDILRGGLVWDDELPDREADRAKHLRGIRMLVGVIAHRSDLTLGNSRPERGYEADWNKLKEIFPDWPGFREERIYGKIERTLRAIRKKEDRVLSQAEAEFDQEQSS